MKRLPTALFTSLCVLAASTHGEAKPHPASAAAAEPASPAPDAAAKKEAARRFEHAIKLYEDGDYSVALAEFERVYELVPDYRVLYNIGQVSIQLGHYARALLTLKEYIARGGNELPADRARSVQADLEQLAGRTASIALEVEPDAVEVTVDGRVVGTTPLTDVVVVDVGERSVELKRAGYVSQATTLSLAGGDRYVGKFKLVPEAAVADRPGSEPPVAVAFPPAEKPLPAKRRTGIYIGYAATGALAAGAAISFGLGASAAGDLKDLRNTDGATHSELEAASKRAKTRLLVSTVLGAGALVTGAVTLYFHLSSSSKERPRAQNDLWLGVAPNQISLAGSPAWLQ